MIPVGLEQLIQIIKQYGEYFIHQEDDHWKNQRTNQNEDETLRKFFPFGPGNIFQ